ncbi:hypothetical protein [Flavobacterium sp. ACN6]|uniref:hypothetical protein n=1 Tax=Flavobacterium sp. ACN6 TaxID=1920426 RepID=UPI000BB31C85|nr:hypothetical protein [Flavobacterium sp. ACN6]PBJ04991.1 hypothetical protein BSF42_43900 [Flavobacterium sp. ACN6]
MDYTIKKTAPISGNVNLKSYLELDEFTPSNTTFFDVKEIKNILFSKSHSEEVYNFFNESVDHYIKEGKGFNVLGKVSNKDKLLLLCLSETEQFAVIFIMNKNNEIIDSKFIIVGDPAINESIFDFVED